jgi:Holliday junction resolvase
MSEKSRRQAIREALTHEGYLVTAYPAGPFGGRGVADFIVCAHGCYIEIEVKDDKGKETPAQLARQEQVKRAGGFAFTARTPAEALLGVWHALQDPR